MPVCDNAAQMSLAGGFDYFQVGRKQPPGVFLGPLRILLKPLPQLITCSEVHRLAHFRSGVPPWQGHV